MTGRSVLAVGAIALGAGACKSDQGLVLRDFEAIAVVSGDFDYVEATLDRLLVPFQLYEGFTDSPAYEFDGDPDDILLTAEGLFAGVNSDGDRELEFYDAVFVNSGARGMGAYVYNGVLPDDTFLVDPDVVTALQGYVQDGGVLVLSDWAYDLLEVGWPEKVDFYGDDVVFDDAQAGSTQQIVAQVTDGGLELALDNSQLALDYNFSNWAAIESVQEGVNVHLRSDVEVRLSSSEGYGTLGDSPLLISFDSGSGQVFYSTFHWNAQPGAVSAALMRELIERLPVGSAEETEETEDTGGAE